MAEVTTNPKELEDATLKALQTLLQNLPKPAKNARDEFYEKFKHTADEYDRDFIKKYDEDLNTTLIFAGLFSAVASAFIIDVQNKLEPDYQEMGYAVLQIIANATLGVTPRGTNVAFPQWNGPDSTIVRVQAILYSSLALALFSAFIAMLGKQWLNRYAQVEMRGSVIDRSRYRQRKMDGMVTWRFDFVMECLPLMLQAALLLLSCALSDYLYFINKVVASILIGFTAFGLLFYILIISAATLSFTCPFQTPPSLILRYLIRFDSEHRGYLKKARKWIRHIFPRKKKQPRQGPDCPHPLPAPNAGRTGDHEEIPMANQFNQPSPFFNKDGNWDGYIWDSNCIAWMFEMTTDADFILAIIKFIPEITWHAGIQTTPLERLYDTLVDCFDNSTGRPIVIPKLRDKAYFSAKAVLHLAIQRSCIGDERSKVLLKTISDKHITLGSYHYEKDSDLESTLGFIDDALGKSGTMGWKHYAFTASHHAWMCQPLICSAWAALEKSQDLPAAVKQFILHTIYSKSPPPSIAIDIFFLVGCLFGANVQNDALLLIDRSPQVSIQADRIIEKLEQTFGQFTSDDIYHAPVDQALQALVMIYSLPDIISPSMSYKIFQIVMQSHVPKTCSEKKWKVSCMAIHSAYIGSWPLSDAEGAITALTFLNHYFSLGLASGKYQDEPIRDALCVLASISSPTTIEAINQFNPTGNWLIYGIKYALQSDRALELRKAAFLFLPLIVNIWFHPSTLIMGSTEMETFCQDWASTLDSIEPTPATFEPSLVVLFGMISSPLWRPHIVPDVWKILEHFRLVTTSLESLHLCIGDPGLIAEIRHVENPKAMVLWAEILWFNYTRLVPEIQEQLVIITVEISGSEGGTDPGASESYIDRYLSNVDLELRETEEAQRVGMIQQAHKVEMLKQAHKVLNIIKQGKNPWPLLQASQLSNL